MSRHTAFRNLRALPCRRLFGSSVSKVWGTFVFPLPSTFFLPILAAVFVLLVSPALGHVGESTFFVKEEASGNELGGDWGNACTLEYALEEIAGHGHWHHWIVNIHAGTHTLTEPFDLPERISLEGGWYTEDNVHSYRDPLKYLTIIQADFGSEYDGQPMFRSEYPSCDWRIYCVTLTGLSQNPLLTMTGYSQDDIENEEPKDDDPNVAHPKKGTIELCVISGNTSAAPMIQTSQGCELYLRRCRFSDNLSWNCTFVHVESFVSLQNCLLDGNVGSQIVRAVAPGELMLENCTFARNTASYYGIVNVHGDSDNETSMPAKLSITNTIFSANTVFGTYVVYKGGNRSEGRVLNSLFHANKGNSGASVATDANTSAGIAVDVELNVANPETWWDENVNHQDPRLTEGFGLEADSPAIDVGAAGMLCEWSLGWRKPRVVGARIDLGAREYNYAYEGVSGDVVYVKPTPCGDQSGSSWANAKSLESARAAAADGQMIWIAGSANEYALGATFPLKNGMKIFGGFAGTETRLEERVFPPTVGTTIRAGSSVPMILSADNTDGWLVDGVNLTGDCTEGESGHGRFDFEDCSGMIVNSTIFDCENSGLLITTVGDTAVEMKNVWLHDNSLGMDNEEGSLVQSWGWYAYPNLTMINCIVSGNLFGNWNWGPMFSGDFGDLHVENCTIARNTTYDGAFTDFSASTATLENTIFYENRTNSDPMVADFDVSYCLFHGNKQYDDSDSDIRLDEEEEETCIIGENPLLNPPGYFISSSDSPAVDAGDPESGLATDILGDPRPYDGDGEDGAQIDIGADEYTLPPDGANVIYVTPDGAGNHNGTSWANACTLEEYRADHPGNTGAGETLWLLGGPEETVLHPIHGGSFILADNQRILGGFSGNELHEFERDSRKNITHIRQHWSSGNPCLAASGRSGWVIDGVVFQEIEEGEPAALALDASAVGTVRHSIFHRNLDGCIIRINGADSDLTLENCGIRRSILDNGERTDVVRIDGGTARLTNCVVTSTDVVSEGGNGNLFSLSSDARLIMKFCTIELNQSVDDTIGRARLGTGGGTVEIHATIFSHNNCREVNRYLVDTNNAIVVQSQGFNFVHDNTSRFDSCSPGAIASSCTSRNPLYERIIPVDECPLAALSPVRDAVPFASYPEVTEDIDGRPRNAGCGKDAGAYEFRDSGVYVAGYPWEWGQ